MKNTVLILFALVASTAIFLMSSGSETTTPAEQQAYIQEMVEANITKFIAEKEADCRELAMQRAIVEADELILTAKTASPKPRNTKPKPPSPKPSSTTTSTNTTTISQPVDTYTPPTTTTYTPPATTTTTTTITTAPTTTTVTTPAKPGLGKGENRPAETTTTTTTAPPATTTTTTPKKPRLGKGKKRDNK